MIVRLQGCHLQDVNGFDISTYGSRTDISRRPNYVLRSTRPKLLLYYI